MLTRSRAPLALVVAGYLACARGRIEMRGAAYVAGSEPWIPHDAAAARFPLPAPHEAVGASLANGWPVWIVRHDDDSVSVLSGVAAPVLSARAFFQHDAGLVRWIPGLRRFTTDNVIYDERGHVIGYPVFDVCAGECPRIGGLPREQRDLEAFDTRVEEGMVRVGARHDGAMRAVATTWVEWLREESAERQADSDAAGRPPVPTIEIAQAASRPPGSYALVAGSIVRTTFDAPRVCTPERCEPCPAEAPLVTGVAGDRANVPSVEAQMGVFLLRRESTSGFAVIARIASGGCASEAPAR